MCHEVAITCVVSCHLTLVVGMQICIGKQLLETREAGVHWPSYKMHNFRVRQCGKNERNVEIINRQFIDEKGRLRTLFGGRAEIHLSDVSGVDLCCG